MQNDSSRLCELAEEKFKIVQEKDQRIVNQDEDFQEEMEWYKIEDEENRATQGNNDQDISDINAQENGSSIKKFLQYTLMFLLLLIVVGFLQIHQWNTEQNLNLSYSYEDNQFQLLEFKELNEQKYAKGSLNNNIGEESQKSQFQQIKLKSIKDSQSFDSITKMKGITIKESDNNNQNRINNGKQKQKSSLNNVNDIQYKNKDPFTIKKQNKKQNDYFVFKKVYQNEQNAKNNHDQLQFGIDGIQDRYEFPFSNQVLIKNFLTMYYGGQYHPNSQIFLRGIKLMEVNHHVNYEGELNIINQGFYKSKQLKKLHFQAVLNEQKQHCQITYQISKFINDQIRFCVVVLSNNNQKSRLYLRNLDSIFQQQYKNYHLVYINDASTDDTLKVVNKYLDKRKIPKDKYLIVNNQVRKGGVENYYNAGHQYCKEGQVMVFVDGDDALIGRQVFSTLNAVYRKQKVALTYGTNFVITKNYLLKDTINTKIDKQILLDGSYRSFKKFLTHHLKTMYVDVFRQIKIQDFKYPNGTFYDHASDVVYMVPAVELAGDRIRMIQQLNYQYHWDMVSNQPFQKQEIIHKIVFDKNAYKRMEEMHFADNPQTQHFQ